jgi:hypothetical protein
MHNLILQDLRRHGAALLRRAVPPEPLIRLRRLVDARFDAVSSAPTEGFGFTPFSYSMRVAAVPEHQEILEHILGLDPLFRQIFGGPVACNVEESWLRKRFAPCDAPRHYQPNRWHQDGGLGVHYPLPAAPPPQMTRLVTCWLPLEDCGRDRPGLELVRQPLASLLHFSECDDQRLHERFTDEMFWAPEMQVGDALVFQAGCVHRTYVQPEMTQDRLSIEYRFFPA